MSAVFDHGRRSRIGIPEAVFCRDKDDAHLAQLLLDLKSHGAPVLLTRLEPAQHERLPQGLKVALDYHVVSQTAYLNGAHTDHWPGPVAVVSAGTSDSRVASEAARTLEHAGAQAQLIEDVGVAGIWRLERRLAEVRKASVVIAVAGWDAALVSVLGGLVAVPLIAVPTSSGYGVAAGGQSALASILASCAPGVVAVNIDNGYGAACAALRLLAAMREAAAPCSTVNTGFGAE